MLAQFNPKTGARGIEWCDYTDNLFGGCEYRCRWQMPDGTIAECYAENLAENGVAKLAYPNGFASHYERKLSSGRFDKIPPSLIFRDSMSDLFGTMGRSADELDHDVMRVLDEARNTPQHTHIVLTKTPGRLKQFATRIPPNVWILVSSPPDYFKSKPLNQKAKEAFVRKAVEALRFLSGYIPVVGMSIEPLSWDVAPLLQDHPLRWVIIGAASRGREYYQPDPSHVQNLLNLFDETGTPVFFKGNLKWNPRREDFPVVSGYHHAVMRRQHEAIKNGWPINGLATNPAVGNIPLEVIQSAAAHQPALI